jgi:tRNA dimethylallyltransferase
VHANNYDGVINALAHALGNDPDRVAESVPTRQVMLGVDRPAAEIDRRVAETYDDQVRRARPTGRNPRPRRALRPAEPVPVAAQEDTEPDRAHPRLHEWFDVALERGKPVENLAAVEQDEVRGRVVERIPGTHPASTRGLPEARGADDGAGAREAFDAVAAALRGPGAPRSGAPSRPVPVAGLPTSPRRQVVTVGRPSAEAGEP